MFKHTGKSLLLYTLLFCAYSSARAAEPDSANFPGLTYPIRLTLPAGEKIGAALYESAFSLAPAKDYDTLLLEGEMSDPAMRVDIEVKSKAFFLPNTGYKQTGFHRFPNGRFWARYNAGPAGRQPLRFVVVNLGVQPGATLTIYSSELQKEAALREEREPQQVVPYVPDAALSLPENAPFTLVRRAQWKAAAPKEPFTPHAPVYFTLHHTQAHYPATYAESVAEIQFIQDFHQNGRGWIDIGYHFLIDPLGNIFEGRPINVVGAHTKNRNTGNIGISIMGSYHPPVSNPFTAATQNSLLAVGTYLKDTYTVNKSSFYAHRDLQSNTDCPGNDLYAKMGTLRDLIFDPHPVAVPVIPGTIPVSPVQSRSLRSLMEYLDR
ncbi:MAG TPA: N-acetylmuramoyl-L-alanine amidase [Elusimicrobiales bacterium]|nr:N-acetylmuramoyl-L-alanine amidase [Elusimicrobiales bacterium]